ncbi:MAG: RluA family pseudouridine synthase [Clostridia bacterium]|nr:RluA family pseudouridine synthase [Clostridia bacterium]
MNVYEAIVPSCAEGMQAARYIQQAMPLLPAHTARDAFVHRDVKMDGKRVGRDEIVVPGARIKLFSGFTVEIPVVYEDEAILLLNKPAGINCDEDIWGGMTVLSLMTRRAGGDYQPRLCHRLDNPTSGLLLLCKDDASETLLRDMFEQRKLTKIYQCLVKGEMRPREAVKEAYLVKNSREATVRVVTHETPGALPIATRYETLEFDGKISRLRVQLLTGRTHQIRAHMSFLSHPILGDDKYGDRNFNKAMKAGGLKLCATELTLCPEGKLAYLRDQHFQIQPPF